MLISKFDLKRKMNKYKVRSQVPSDLQGRSLEPSLHPIRDPRALSPKVIGNPQPNTCDPKWVHGCNVP